MVTAPAVLNNEKMSSMQRLATDYRVPVSVVEEIYSGIKKQSSPELAKSVFPMIFTERELKARGYAKSP